VEGWKYLKMINLWLLMNIHDESNDNESVEDNDLSAVLTFGGLAGQAGGGE
jgi:hypothetical protein